jgi:hypothetical protein
MTATWLEPAPWGAPGYQRSRGLRLVSDGALPGRYDEGWDTAEEPVPFTVVPRRPAPRRVSPAVRRRRTLLVVIGLLLLALALPLSGTGGNSHATGSALAETGRPVSYVVQPGDTLWSIAERVDPTGDPRPLVARLAAQTGSDTVVPGERLVLP